MLSKNSSAVALLLGALSAPVSATVMTSFEYLGTINFGFGPTVPDLNLLPAGGARNASGNIEIDTQEAQAFAANVGYGQVTPSLAYGAGSVAAGDVQVRSRTQMQLVITNDSTSVRTADWQFLIFAGGAGINTPDFNAANCDLAALDQCGTWLNNLDSTADVDDGDLASLSFSTELDSTSGGGGIETLFSGDISVTGQSVGPAVLASSFSDANLLDGFTSTNMDFSWDETLLNRALGVFQAGETKTLTFVVDTLASATGACVDASGISCVTGYAGFGDPPGGGGRVMYRSFSSVPSSPNLPPNGQVVWSDGTIDAPQGPNPPTAGVPIVSTPLLLLAGLLPALWFRRRRNS